MTDFTSETAQQRDRAVTIYEKSEPGRRAFVAAGDSTFPTHRCPS